MNFSIVLAIFENYYIIQLSDPYDQVVLRAQKGISHDYLLSCCNKIVFCSMRVAVLGNSNQHIAECVDDIIMLDEAVPPYAFDEDFYE